jgi:hypothetical protein
MRIFFRHAFLYLFLIIAVMAVTSFTMYQKKKDTASATLTLNYEEAAKGLYPNSTRFSISLIKSKEVLNRVIEKAGLSGITAEQIAANISATGTGVNGLGSGEGDYSIATSYVITYKQNTEISQIGATEMLKLILQAYKEEFYENYAYGNADLTCQIDDYDDLEYLEIAELFTREGNKITRYLKEKINENGTFQSEKTGETFASLKKLIDNFMDVDLEKYSSFVTQSGLSKDKERYIDKLEYQNKLLDIQYQKFMGEYQIRLDAIDIYDAALTAVVLVPTVDTEREFYMSRTKVSIDYQAEAAKSANSNANDVNEQINENKYVISQLETTGASSQKDIEKAESMILEMKAKLEEITEKTVVTNREYTRYKTKNYLSTTITERSTADLLSVKWMLFAGCGMSGLIGVWILVSYLRKRGEQG